MSNPLLPVARLLAAVTPFVTRQPGNYGAATPLPRLTVWSSTHATPPTPAMFQPMFYAVLQGTKALTIGGHQLRLSAGACAATSFGLPYVGQLEDATRAMPYVAIGLDLDIDLLTDVMLDMPRAEDRWACSAAGGTLEGSVGDAFTRLIELLAAPDDQSILGRNYEAELYYRLLQSPMSDTLRQLGRRDSRSRQIKVAADWLCANPNEPVIIPNLAAKVGMSQTSFHRHFKAVTGYSPLAFQRQVRLLEARRLLLGGGISVSRAAYAVGYVSPSQFSREYKSLFGAPPAKDMMGTPRAAVA
jgi:AraC-like DNA-binding protein